MRASNRSEEVWAGWIRCVKVRKVYIKCFALQSRYIRYFVWNSPAPSMMWRIFLLASVGGWRWYSSKRALCFCFFISFVYTPLISYASLIEYNLGDIQTHIYDFRCFDIFLYMVTETEQLNAVTSLNIFAYIILHMEAPRLYSIPGIVLAGITFSLSGYLSF